MENEIQAPADNSQGTEEEIQEVATSFVNGKYNSVSALEEGYTNLASKFGSFTGSPEEYSMGEEVEYNKEHPLFSQLEEYGKENNLSNEGYQKLVNVLLDNERTNIATQEAEVAEVMKNLGDNAPARIQNIDDFVNANMQVDESMKDLINEAKEQPGGVEMLEAFIAMSKKTPPASEQVAAPIKSYSKDELHNMQFAMDEYGNRKMNDPSYRRKVENYHANLIKQG